MDKGVGYHAWAQGTLTYYLQHSSVYTLGVPPFPKVALMNYLRHVTLARISWYTDFVEWTEVEHKGNTFQYV